MKEIGKYVDSFKKFVRWYLKGERIDVEWIDESEEKDVFWGGNDFVVIVEKGWMRVEWRGEEDVESKEELWRVLGLGDENKVLNCGKIGSKFVGISSLCVCIYYEDGREKWSIDDFGWYEKWDESKKWFRIERKIK